MRKIPVFLLFLVLFLISFSVLTQNDDFTPPSAIDYAPNFWFDSEEKYYPVNPLDFYFENGIEIIGEIAVDKYNQLSFEEKLNQITVFYHIKDEGNQWVYQYWFFYAFNDFPKLIKNKHYGDWESVFVFVDKDSNKVIKVIGTAHQRKLFDTEIYAPGINHIWTYIGNGSHANCIDEEDDGYCDFFKWRKWEKWDKNGPKISYSDYRLQEINLDFINGFEGAITLENSSKLGINIFDFFKTSEKEFYISLGGKPPIHAWEQESFYNPEVLRPISWKYLVEKVDQIKDKIIGFFKKIEPDQQQAAISSSLYTPLEHILTSIVSETIEEELNEQEIEPIIPELIPDKEIKEELKIEDKEIEEAEESQSIAQPTPPMGFPFFIGGSGAPPIEESIELEPEPEPEPLPAETPSGAEESEPEPEIDTIPPLAIVDLSVSSGDSRGTINLSWTSPGADQYIIKYATSSEITSLNWASSTDIVGELTPSLASTTENFSVSGLDINQIYYFAIKSQDEAGNISDLSNVASISILATAENLIISEIAVQGSNGASDEFIEIYNPTDSPINLSGWSLQYASAQATTTWQYKYFWIDDSSSRDLPDFNLASHQYFLLTSATSSNYYSYGMQPDLAAVTTAGNPTYLGLSDTGGKIRLLNNNEEIIDLVAWGEDSLGAEGNPVGIDNFFWGSLERQAFASSTAELLAVNGAHHWSGNSIDRDDNSQDFVLQTVPNPQNSLSLVEPDAIFPELANTAWPMLQGDIQHSGLSAYVGTATGTPTSSPKWIVDLGSGSPSSPVIGLSGEIYIGAASGNLYKISSATGTAELFYKAPTNGTIQTPAIASDGTIYISDNYHYLYALSSDGELKWKYNIHDGSSPTIDSDGTIYVGSSYYGLYALNPNGELIWESPQLSNGRWTKAPVLDSDGIIYTVGKIGTCSCCKVVYALDFQDGSIVWQTNSGPYSTTLSLSDQGIIFVGGSLALGSSGLYAFNSSDGSQQWYSSIGNISNSVSAIGSNRIYVGSQDYLYALNSEGESQWPYAMVNTQDEISASPIIDAIGTIYIGSRSQKFYAINPDGTVKWQAELSSSISHGAVIDSDGVVYVVSDDGNLYAF